LNLEVLATFCDRQAFKLPRQLGKFATMNLTPPLICRSIIHNDRRLSNVTSNDLGLAADHKHHRWWKCLCCKTISSKLLGNISLITSILVFSSNSAVYQGISNANPEVFTACNVLCAQSLVGLALLLPLFWRDLRPRNLANRTKTEWIALIIGTILFSVLGPFFNLTALHHLSVPSVAILQMVEPVCLVLFARVFFGEIIDSWSGCNTFLNVIGIAVAVASSPFFGQPVAFPIGSVYQLLSSVCYVASLLISNSYLHEVPMGLLLVGDTALHCTALHCTALHCTALDCATLQSFTSAA
jgi:drug/metabolite transporter (DMT)-like permease